MHSRLPRFIMFAGLPFIHSFTRDQRTDLGGVMSKWLQGHLTSYVKPSNENQCFHTVIYIIVVFCDNGRFPRSGLKTVCLLALLHCIFSWFVGSIRVGHGSLFWPDPTLPEILLTRSDPTRGRWVNFWPDP